ncbi:MAG: glycyl-radical enzyme activating protein [Clostridia bacterium]|nr:glycyl-radical enzyme activating protein [Clostridia bacterium]
MATVFNIQHFSIHDGPGIRTTVFFSGCPLRCLWCHNPESQSTLPQIACFANRCTRCGICIEACPEGALHMEEGRVMLDRRLCTACGTCVDACPVGARERYGEGYSPEELAARLLRDLPYYKKSGGGVTLSGGEPLLHTAFVLRLAELLHDAGIHVAVESCAYADYERSIEPLLSCVDLWMVDIKAMDDDRHRAVTGVPLQPILENISRMSRAGACMLIRVPVVVGVNDDEPTMRALADFLKTKTEIRTVELLKMHKLAAHKYEALDRPYPISDTPVPSEERMQLLARTLAACGICAVWGEQTFQAE